MDHQQLSLLLYILLFCLILYLARILIFIVFTGKIFFIFYFSRPDETGIASRRVRREGKSQRGDS